MSLRVVNWNLQWATPSSRRTPEILRRIGQHAPEIACLTESHVGLLANDGHVISSQPNYGYPIKEDRRKVVLWSREPWAQVDDLGSDSLPPGRFVSGVTGTSLGAVTVFGICIPWFGSRTEARRNPERKLRWEDHGQYLAGLTKLLEYVPASGLIVMGDFNQIVGPGSRAPRELQEALQNAFPPGMSIVTSELALQGRRTIDHIVLSNDFSVEALDTISYIRDGRRLSDHFGVAATLSAKASL